MTVCKLKKFFKNQTGMTMPEIMVWIALSAVLIATMGQLFSRLAADSKQSMVRKNFQDAETKVQVFADFCVSL